MAIKRRQAPVRPERAVSLLRKGSEGAKAQKNTRREIKAKQEKKRWRPAFSRYFPVAAVAIFSVSCVVALSLGLLYGYRFLTTSPYFTLKSVEIQGNSRLSSREILENSSLSEGANTLALSIADVEQHLARDPWVKEVSIKRILPNRLVIGISEREPAFLVLLQNGMYYADEQGSIIAPVTPNQFTPLPTLEVEKGAENSTAYLPELIRHIRETGLPLGGKNITFVRLSASRGVELYIDDSRLKLSVGLEEWLDNLNRLSRTLEDLNRRKEIQGVREIKAYGSNVWVEKTKPSGV